MNEEKMPMVVRNERKAITDSQIEEMRAALNAIQAATSARACKAELEPISRIVAQLANAEHLPHDDDDATDSIQALPESIAKAKQFCENDFVDEFKRLYAHSKKRVLHLIVSHGTPIRRLSRSLGGKKKKLKFCAVSAFAIQAVPE